MRTSFYTYFSSAYGTLWIAMFVLSFITRSQIQLGGFGLYGFPFLALVYAVYRRSSDAVKLKDRDDLRL